MCKACKHFVSDDQFNEILTCNCMEGNVFDPEDLKRGVDALRKFKVVDPKRSHVKKAANFGGSSKKKKGGGRK